MLETNPVVRRRGHRRVSLVFATSVLAIFGALALAKAPAAAASTCTDTVHWVGISGTVKTDSCRTGVHLFGECPGLESIESQTVSKPGDVFGLGTRWLPFAGACASSGQSPFNELYFEERGSWELVKSSLDGSGWGDVTRKWTAR